jgi:hypothetical protein
VVSLSQRVAEALVRHEVPRATGEQDGFRVEEMLGDLVIVRWGRGEPFRSTAVTRDGSELALCMAALKRERLLVAPNEFEDVDGLFIAVRESSL